MLMIGVGVLLSATGPDASSPHFVVLNDSVYAKGGGPAPNVGTVFNLTSRPDPKLTAAAMLTTGGEHIGRPLQEVAMLQHGTDTCIYLADPGTADIASFTYPSFAEAGRYTVPGVTNASFGLGLAARGNFLFASYSTQDGDYGFFIATWNIQSGCSLILGPTYDVPGDVSGMAISPDGKTLATGYDYGGSYPAVDSFSVGSDGTLTEHGPYPGPFGFPTGVDITADSRYAIYAEYNGDLGAQVQVGIYAINVDGSFGVFNTFFLGPVGNASNVWLSPNEKFLFVGDTSAPPLVITTLNFDESVPKLTYTGCTARAGMFTNGMATALPTGAGGFLYLAEETSKAGVGLFEINPSTGCLKQVPGSPFLTGMLGNASSVAAWPPRPF